MKKLSFLLGAVALLTASCSNDEVIDVTQAPGISFDTFVDKSTRSTDMNNAELEKTGFSVYAITKPYTETKPSSLFINQKVEWNGSAWTYTPPQYWTKGNDYRFTAFAPYGATGLEVTQSVADITDFSKVVGGLTFTLDNSTAKANVDLCYDFKKLGNIQSTNPGQVDLTFSHMLSRVKFTFKNSFEATTNAIVIEKLKILNVYSKGTINKVNGENTWTKVEKSSTNPDENKFDIDFIMGESTSVIDKTKIPGNGGTQSSEHHYLIPFTEAQTLDVTFDVVLYIYDKDQEKFLRQHPHTHKITLNPINFESNKSYNFIAEIDNTNINPNEQLHPITFSANVSDWTSNENPETDVNIETPKTPDTPTGGGSTETPSNP